MVPGCCQTVPGHCEVAPGRCHCEAAPGHYEAVSAAATVTGGCSVTVPDCTGPTVMLQQHLALTEVEGPAAAPSAPFEPHAPGPHMSFTTTDTLGPPPSGAEWPGSETVPTTQPILGMPTCCFDSWEETLKCIIMGAWMPSEQHTWEAAVDWRILKLLPLPHTHCCYRGWSCPWNIY